MKLNPYLFFNGNCEAAFKFYEQCLGGKIVTMMTYENAPTLEQKPSELPANWDGKIMHVCLEIGDYQLMGSDCPPHLFEETKGCSVQISIDIDDPAEAERIFHVLAENGTVKMPFSPTFWSSGFGTLVDKFGIPWMIGSDKAA